MAANLAATRSELDDPAAAKRLFRRVMGRFATGVTVVTTSLAGEVYGMTANAFMAGSLDPLLCVVSISRTAQMHERLIASGHYGVSFLSQDQRHLAAHFAGQRLAHIGPQFGFRGGTPVLERAVGSVTAEVVDTAACGDHTLFIGRITSMEEAPDGRPLLFCAGRYARVDLLTPIEEVDPPEFW
jgi:flavin reductase (DIM6/NTAB) family NADH-FMN oxidoreductase RutF